MVGPSRYILWFGVALVGLLPGCIERLKDASELDQLIAQKQAGTDGFGLQDGAGDGSDDAGTAGDAGSEDLPRRTDQGTADQTNPPQDGGGGEETSPGSCATSADCNDASPCTIDSCIGNTCSYQAVTTGNPCPEGQACSDGACKVAAVCGNGKLEGGEDCDDSNTNPGDGCDGTCHQEGAPPAPMTLIPAGSFNMGCSGQLDSDCDTNTEGPVHSVSLSSFWIDQNEVDWGQWSACKTAGSCSAISSASGCAAKGAGLPVVCATFNQAKVLCSWAGKRLCTEAEWEYAARGKGSLRYPWGADSGGCTEANKKGCGGQTQAANLHCSSPFGVCNLAGNVAEWVADEFGAYSPNSLSNPEPAVTGSGKRIVRGGHWDSPYDRIRGAARDDRAPTEAEPVIGIRCCKSVK